MKATLIYNPQAGRTKRVGVPALLAALRQAGLDAEHAPTATPSDLPGALAAAEGLLVVAGGDGTLRMVFCALVPHLRPIALLPMGTANNVARSLGVLGKPLELARKLAAPRRVAFDVGAVLSPWGETFFLEALGVGLFAELLRRYDPAQGKSVRRAFETLLGAADYAPLRHRILLDGLEISGTYLAVEALNTQATGPRLQLAPDARPDDGRLDILCAVADAPVRLLDYAVAALRGSLHTLPNVQILRGTRLDIHWKDEPLHVDADLFPPSPAAVVRAGARVEVRVMPGALELVLPGLEP
jgi:diacylglycerol kinase (ATP)